MRLRVYGERERKREREGERERKRERVGEEANIFDTVNV